MADTKLSALTELATTPASNDEVYIRDVSEAAATESKRITIANLLAGAPTKEFFVPVTNIKMTGAVDTIGQFPCIALDANGEYYKAVFKVPHDFTALTYCKVIVIPAVTGTIDWSVFTQFAAIGEAYSTHTDTHTVNGLAMVNTIINGIDISLALTGLAADDYVGVRFDIDVLTTTTDVDVIGILFKYS